MMSQEINVESGRKVEERTNEKALNVCSWILRDLLLRRFIQVYESVDWMLVKWFCCRNVNLYSKQYCVD